MAKLLERNELKAYELSKARAEGKMEPSKGDNDE